MLLTGAFLLATGPATSRAAEARFSQTLAASEIAETGLGKLSSDQIAVIDALVRRDLATQAAPRRNEPPSATRFSQRLTADERRTAGLTLLTQAELTRLDELVERNTASSLTRLLLAPPVFIPAGMRLRSTDEKPAAELHGSVSLSYGFGKGGYSEKTGAMNVNYQDPAHGFILSVGYAETELKSPSPWRNTPPASLPPPVAP